MATTGHCNNLKIEINRSQLSDVSLKKIFPDVINLKKIGPQDICLKRSFPDVANLKSGLGSIVTSLKRSLPGVDTFPDASLKKNFPGVNDFAFTFVFAKVFTSLKRSFPGVDNLEPGSGSTLGFTIPEVDSKMIPGVDNHGWSNFLVEMTPKSTVESL